MRKDIKVQGSDTTKVEQGFDAGNQKKSIIEVILTFQTLFLWQS